MPISRFYRMQRARLSAAPLTLRPSWGWRGRVLGALGILLAALLLVAVGAWLGWREAADTHRDGLSGQAERIAEQGRMLASETAARRLAEQQLTVEQATRDTLARELARAQADAASRQEALIFLDSLLTANDRSRAIRIVACELQPLGSGKFRYRALLAQGVNNAAEFNGRLLVGVDFLRRGQKGHLATGEDKLLPIRVRHYERAEGELDLPADATPQLLDIRVISADSRQVVAQCQKKTGGV